MSAAVRVELLGPVRVWRDRQAVRVNGRRQRLLLCVLAAEHRRTVPSARSIDALWGDREPQDPQNTVQQYVAQLRRALDAAPPSAGVLVTSPPGYRLDLPVGGLDLDELERLSRRARESLTAGDTHDADSFAERALGLWRGEPFEEFAEHPFLLGAEQRARHAHLEAVEVLAEARRVRAGPAAVVDLLDARPEWWTQREALAVLLVWALATLDRGADALERAECSRRASAERGVEPGPALTRVAREVAVYGRVRTPLGVAGPRTPAESVLRDLLATLPSSQAHDGVDAASLLAHHVAVARALNSPSIAMDTQRWLDELARHAPSFDRSLHTAVTLDPVRGLDLALELARYWDWTGDSDRLRHVLARLLDALPERAPARRADAHGWLAFAWMTDDPDRAFEHLRQAISASQEGDELGRTRAVEAVLERMHDPARSLAAAEEAVDLLRRHGSADEAAYADVTAALAALALDQGEVADRHVADAAAVYADLEHPSGLAWIDVIEARLHHRQPERAIRFARVHSDSSVTAMLEGQDGRGSPG